MKLRFIASAVSGAVVALSASVVFAQATPANSGYVLSATGAANNNVVRSGRYGTNNASCNLCWRTSYWTPAMAIAECDPDLVKKAAAAPAPAPAPAATAKPAAPAPAAPAAAAKPATPAAAPAAPSVQKITLASKALFDFDKAVLKPEGQAVLDREIVSRIKEVQKLELVLVTGHTDRLGSQQYNQKLSERRAAAVASYLASKGVAKDKIETLGMGKTQPVPGVVCEQKNRKALIACLQPHRRVEVEVKGEIVIRK
ncbi:MAG TPA: OmpA family protein [Casimicrobium sp.]|jgi:OOP family OmpA-OmpF porin|nr:OmpA family protein [Casimicrobium sp.]